MDDNFYNILRKKLISFFSDKGYSIEVGNIDAIDNFIFYFTFENDIKKDLVWVSIQSDSDRERFVMNFITRRKINVIESFFPKEYLEILKDTRSRIYTINLFSEFLEEKRLHFSEEIKKDIEGFSHRIFEYINNRVLPSFKKYPTIIDLDKEVNKELKYANPLAVTNYWFYKLVIAKLSNNMDFYSKLYTHIIDMYKRGINKYPDNPKYKNCLNLAEQLHKDLEKINPDENYVIA